MEGVLDEELDEKLGYSKYDYRNKNTDNSRNGHSKKSMHTSYGDMEMAVPRDRNGDYEPQLIKKYQNTVFSTTVRKVIYSTNAIESLNATYRKRNRQRSVFPSDTALLKALYLSTFEATKKWTMPIRNWGQVYGELRILYEGRLPE